MHDDAGDAVSLPDYWIIVKCAGCGEEISSAVFAKQDLAITDAIAATEHEQAVHQEDDKP